MLCYVPTCAPCPSGRQQTPSSGRTPLLQGSLSGHRGFSFLPQGQPADTTTCSSRAPPGLSLAVHTAPCTPRAPRWQSRGADPSLLLAIPGLRDAARLGLLCKAQTHLSWYRTASGLKHNQHRCPVTLPCSRGFKNPLLSGLLNQLMDPLIKPLLVSGHLPLLLWKENQLNTGKIRIHWH